MIRRQASLFVEEIPWLDALRQKYNPAQAALIPPHLTLIREDEVQDWSQLGKQVAALEPIELRMQIGKPLREEDFVYLPAVDTALTPTAWTFDRLREALLATQLRDGSGNIRKPKPHLTLIHPRNGECTDTIFQEIQQSVVDFEYTFREIRIIEQRDGGPWRTLKPIEF